MARRKPSRNTTPNIPEETLLRAKRQLEGESVEPETTATAETTAQENLPEAQPVAEVMPLGVVATRTRPANRPSARQRISAARAEERKRELDADGIADLLNNPTTFPTAEDLGKAYAFVVRDLRNMFVLAGALMVFLVVIAQFIG